MTPSAPLSDSWLAPAHAGTPVAVAHACLVADGDSPVLRALLADAALTPCWVGARDNALAVISGALAAGNVEVLHIVAHGRGGKISLGGTWLDATSLLRDSHLLAQWQVATIALWCWGIGQNDALVQMLRMLTGARVFASASEFDMVDGQLVWRLDGRAAHDVPDAPFDPVALASWPPLLAAQADQLTRAGT